MRAVNSLLYGLAKLKALKLAINLSRLIFPLININFDCDSQIGNHCSRAFTEVKPLTRSSDSV